MESTLRIALLIIGISFTGVIIYLLVVNKMNEKNSIVWLIGSIGILGISAAPQAVDKIATLVGVEYPPSLLFLISTLILLVCILYFSIQLSALQEKVRQLAQIVAVYKAMEEKKDREIKSISHDG